MELLFAMIFVLLLGVSVAEKPEPSSPVGVSCKAFAALKIRVIGKRSCRGEPAADCPALASAQADFRDAYNAWWSEGKECETAKLEEAALAIAHACARAYAKTIAKVECEGAGGFACGWSIAEGSIFASAMARAMAQAAVDASAADSFCLLDVEEIADEVAEAAASSQSKACVSGEGSEDNFKDALAESLTKVVADAFVTASVRICDPKGVDASSSYCLHEFEEGTLEVERPEAKAGASDFPVCDKGMDECCKPQYRGIPCRCSEATCAGMWRRRRDFVGDLPRLWLKPATKELCQCVMPHV